MGAVLIALGLSFLIGIVPSGGGGSISGEEPDPVENDADDETILSEADRGSVLDYLSGLVANGEVTQTESEDMLAAITFVDGPMDTATAGGDDSVAGSVEDDRILTRGGNDVAYGGAGDDLIELGSGNDLSGVDPRATAINAPLGTGASGVSDAALEAGDDTVSGGRGNDVIADGYGANTLLGGQGHDTLISVDQDGYSPDTVDGGFGRDVLIVDEGDTVTTGGQQDVVTVDLFAGIGAEYNMVTITDFNPEQDTVELEGNYADLLTPPPSGPGDVVVNPITVEDTSDGTGAIISVGGIPVVLVVGGQGMSVDDVQLSV